MNPAVVLVACRAAVEVGVEDVLGTELFAHVDHSHRFGDPLFQALTVERANVDPNAGVVPAARTVGSPGDFVDANLADLCKFIQNIRHLGDQPRRAAWCVLIGR